MSDSPPPIQGRRRFIGALALAPLAACTASRVAAPGPAGVEADAAANAGGGADPYRVLRDAPLPADAEPALAFRALASRRSPR